MAWQSTAWGRITAGTRFEELVDRMWWSQSAANAAQAQAKFLEASERRWVYAADVAGAESETGELFRRGRAGRLRAVEHRAGYQLLARQNVAVPHLLLRRRHRYRLGSPNYNSLPVNRPRCPVHTYNRDGFMRFDGNYGNAPNYEPNTFGGPVEDHRFKELPLKISGDADRYNPREGSDDYCQVGNLFRLMSKEEQLRLFANTARAMAGGAGRNRAVVGSALRKGRSRLRKWFGEATGSQTGPTSRCCLALHARPAGDSAGI
jgi:hypothetical protein